jgi:hypothetical protein
MWLLKGSTVLEVSNEIRYTIVPMALPEKHLLMLTLPLLAVMVCCGPVLNDVDTVRNGVLADYNTTTVGKAFEGTFQNPRWSSFVTPKGQTVVQFEGTTTFEKLENVLSVQKWSGAVDACRISMGLPDDEKIKQQAKHAAETEFRNLLPSPGYSPSLENLADYHEKALMDELIKRVDPCVKATSIPIKFQFLMSVDKKSFQLGYVDEVFGTEDRALSMIYR